MANTLYANVETNRVGTGGASLRLELGADAMTQLTANVTPCRTVVLSAVGASPVHFSASSLTISLGAIVNSLTPVTVHIDDASKLWFSSAAVASVFATYVY